MTDFTAYLRLGVDSRDAVTAQKDLDRMAAAGGRSEKSFSALGVASKALGGALAAVGAGKIAGDLISITRETGIMTASLRTATGSAESAAVAFDAITKLATQLPESVDSVATAFTKLVNYGLNPSEAAIKSYSNTAAALGKDLSQMVEAVADAATGEFERLKEFGIKSKIQGDQVSFTFRGVTETVKNSAAEIEGYLQSIGNNQFAGSAAEQMKELDGAISNLGDTYDGLLRTVSKAGAGDIIGNSVRGASAALQELNDLIASGQLGAYIDAIAIKFSGAAESARMAFEIMSVYYNEFSSMFDGAGGFLLDAFVNLPENIRAFIQLAVVEIASLVDKAMIYGEQIAFAMNPANWFGDMPDISGALAAVDSARMASIETILQERETAIKAFDDQINKANDLRTKYEENAAAVMAGGDALGQFQIKATEAAASSGDLAEKTKQAAEMMKIVEEMEMDDLFQGMEGYDFTESTESIAANREELDELISSVDEFGGAWSRTGSIIADSFGTMGDALNDYASRMESIASKESELAKARMKFMGDPKELEKISKAEKKLAAERTAANLKSFGTIAGAASEMFDEQSKARRTLHGIEVAFNAVEMAMTIQRSLLAAKEAVLTQGKGDPYTAFARMAAMAAVVGALGYAVGGIGGGGGGQSAAQIQGAQGTGSVFGSNDKSESISTAFEEYADIGLEQLGELRMIREGLTGLTGGINKLSVGVITSGLTEAKYVNFANQYVGDIIDRGGLVTRGSRSQDVAGREMLAPLQGQISSIFGFIQESINAATGALEVAQNNPAWAFISDIGKVSFKDLSGEEIRDELNAIFSQQADLITEFVVPAMKEYQQIGEGLFETLTRVASEMATFNYYTDALGLDFNMTGLAAIAAQQAIAEFSGGMDKLTENLQSYYEEFFTEEERAANQMKLLAAEMKNLGYDTVPTSREAFRALVEGIDLTTEAGQKQFAGLIALNEVFAELVPATEAAASAVESLTDSAKNAYDSLSNSISAERARIQGIVTGATTAKSALEKAVAAEKGTIKQAYNERIELLKSQADAEREANRAIGQARIAALNEEADAVRDRIGGLRSLFDELSGAAADMALGGSIVARRRAAEFEIDTALRNAQAGRGLPTDGRLSDALTTLRDNPSSLYANAQEMAYANAVTQNKINELAGFAGQQLTTEEKTLASLETQIASAETLLDVTTTSFDKLIEQANLQYERDISAQDAILASAQAQFDKLTGIDTGTLSVEAALTKFNESMLAADFEDAQEQYARLDGILEQGKLQLDTLLDIDTGVLSLRDAIDRFAAAVNSTDQKKANEELLAEMRRTADELNQLREEQRVQALTQQTKLDETARNTRITANEALA